MIRKDSRENAFHFINYSFKLKTKMWPMGISINKMNQNKVYGQAECDKET